MKTEPIERLRRAIQDVFGPTAIRPYGESEDARSSLGFRIDGVDATFSVLVGDWVPGGLYDIQIESYPPGDYVYVDAVSLERFIEIVRLIAGPSESWPTCPK